LGLIDLYIFHTYRLNDFKTRDRDIIIERLFIKIILKHIKVLVIYVYIPPYIDRGVNYEHCELVENILSNNQDYKILIVGDFNLISFDWINLINLS
jgi:hypothetical protein